MILSAAALSQAALAQTKVRIAGTAKVKLTNIPTVNLNGTPVVRLEGGSTVALQPGSAVSLQPGTTVALQPNATVGLQPGASVALQPGTTVGLQPGTTVSLPTGTKVGLEPGATVGLPPGTTVGLDPGTTVKIDPTSTVKLDTATTVAVADATARQGFQFAAMLSFDVNKLSDSASFIVPDDKILVIEYFSCSALLPLGQYMYADITTTINGVAAMHTFVPKTSFPVAGLPQFILSESTRLYAEPDSQVRVKVYRTDGLGATPDDFPCSLSGHYLDP